MKRIYIDFDSTLYDTGVIKKVMNDIIADGVCKNVSDVEKETLIEEIKEAKANGVRSVSGLCKYFEEKYKLEKNSIWSGFEDFLSNGENLLYLDSVDFLKRLSQEGFEVNILTYTSREDYDYQMLKLMGAKISRFVNNIFMCTKSKGELALDYENSYFVDDSPKELASLFKAGVSTERLIRIRRDGAAYSDIDIVEFKAREYKDFVDIEI